MSLAYFPCMLLMADILEIRKESVLNYGHSSSKVIFTVEELVLKNAERDPNQRGNAKRLHGVR